MTKLMVLDFITSRIDQVIDQVLDMDRARVATSVTQGGGPTVPTSNTIHNLHEPGPLEPRMHYVNPLCRVQLKGTYNRAVRVQFVKSPSYTGTPH